MGCVMVEEDIPVYYESLDSKCEAYPIDAYDAELPISFPDLLCIEFQVFITHIPYDHDSGESFLDDVKCAKKEYTVWAARDRLSRQVVWNVLQEIGVPVEHFMVLNILDCAEMMIKDQRFKNKKVLRMFVDMDVPGSGDGQGLVYYPLDHQWPTYLMPSKS